jgi:parallel beta-helix repeat protein
MAVLVLGGDLLAIAAIGQTLVKTQAPVPEKTGDSCHVTPVSAPAPAPSGTAGRKGSPMPAPSGSVPVRPGAIQAAVDSHGPNTSFRLAAGTYTDDPVAPKDGDRFFGEGQVTWDGGGTKSLAFKAAGTVGVLVSGIRFVHFNTPNQGSGLFGLNNGETGFTVEGCEVAESHGTPIVAGNGTRIINNSIHDNDWVGIGGYNITGVLVERNEIYRNYLAKLSPDTATGEASGIKFVKTREVTVRNNYVHDNFGVGVWFDGDNVGTLIEGNVISGNTYRGVMDEVSFGAIIRQNTITGNGRSSGWIGGAGILIATASGVEVCGNVVKGNAQGIVGFQQDRGVGSMGRFATSHNHVHDNYITMSEGITGFTGGAENDPTNVFYQNHYCLTNDASFIWGNKTCSKGWQAAGQDLRGTFSCGF